MAVITSNGTGGGNWSDGSTWVGGVSPGSGDRSIIVTGDTVYLDSNITIGDGTDSTSTYAVDCAGDLVWRNRAGDSAASWTFTVDGHMRFTDGSRWFIGTEDSSEFGTESVGPIPATRTANIYFANNYHHRIFVSTVDNKPDGFLEIWGAPNFHQDTPPIVSSQTVDSAANRYSFVDSARTSDAANLWRGAWLEVESGTNVGEERAITAFDNVTGTITWSSNQPMPLECDDTTVYKITHNYQRAMLTADASAGAGVTIQLDRPANWQVGDTLGVAVGVDYEQNTERPDYTTIISKVSATEYTCDLTYDHKDGDFVIHMDRNIKFDANLANTSNMGYYFQFNLGNPATRINWAWFENCGYGTSCLSAGTSKDMFIVRNVSAKGRYVGTTVYANYFLNLSGYNYNITENWQLENIHGFSLGGLIKLETNPNPDLPVEMQERVNLRELTLIGASAGSLSLVQNSAKQLHPVKIKNVWLAGRPVNSSSNRLCRIAGGGIFDLDGFICRQSSYAINLSTSDEEYLYTREVKIRNGVIEGIGADHMRFHELDIARLRIENVYMRWSWGHLIVMSRCGINTTLLINNKYNGAVHTSSSGLNLGSEGSGGLILETDGEYGVDETNGQNIYMTAIANTRSKFRYVSYNTKYQTPSGYAVHWPAQPGDIHKIVTMQSGSTWKWRCKEIAALSTIEANNPILDGTPSNSVGLIHCGGIQEIAEHPTVPRVNSNIKLKVYPFAAMGETEVSHVEPLKGYAQQGQTVTISVYARKNTTQLSGQRPKLYVFGNGHLTSTEMTDAIDTWEQLTVSFEARYDGAFIAWFTCANNLKYGKAVTTGDAEYGESDDIGTVVVYFDEFKMIVA